MLHSSLMFEPFGQLDLLPPELLSALDKREKIRAPLAHWHRVALLLALQMVFAISLYAFGDGAAAPKLGRPMPLGSTIMAIAPSLASAPCLKRPFASPASLSLPC